MLWNIHRKSPEEKLKALIAKKARKWRKEPSAVFINRMKQRSMLHQETLTLLDFFARRARCGVLEIGAYMGGGTAVIAQALKETGGDVPFATIEVGGAHDNPYLPSKDILADLRATLADNNVEASIIEGSSNAPTTVQAVRNLLGQRGIDLLIIDADGMVDRDFNLYRDLLVDDAVIVCDDYKCDGVNPKESLVRAWVDGAIANNVVRDLGVYRWGTWFGQLRD